MNEKTMNTIIMNEVMGKLTQVIQDTSNDEFLELIQNKYNSHTGENIGEKEKELVKKIMGDKILPLYTKLVEYLVETQ